METPPEATREILVVEDEAPIAKLWDRFLDLWGFQGVLAENGQMALEKTRQGNFPLVITDLTMPVMTGQELIYHLKQEKPETEIIVTTGHGTIEIAVEMMKAGAYDFLTKPLNFAHAEFVIKKCFDSITARQENRLLRQKNRDLEELNEIKEKFIAITSHELRTPVSIIHQIVGMLEPDLREGSNGNLLQMILRSSGQLNEIVGEMHELSRVYSGRMELQLSRFDLHNLCEEVFQELALALEKRNLTVTSAVPKPFLVDADLLKFKKIMRELLQNAIKFTKDGGRIEVTAELEGEGEDGVRIAVSDSGIGIPDGTQEKIFHLFYEVGEPLHHHTSKDEFLGGGMGVGLAIVKDIVEAHQGRIEVHSKVGKGATFVVWLPQQGVPPLAV